MEGAAVVRRRDVELGELIQDGVEVVGGLAPETTSSPPAFR